MGNSVLLLLSRSTFWNYWSAVLSFFNKTKKQKDKVSLFFSKNDTEIVRVTLE